MSSIVISDDKPGTMPVETGWIEQLVDDAQTAAQMLSSLAVSEQNSECGKFVAVICERVQDLAKQLGQIKAASKIEAAMVNLKTLSV